jgi:hypothetical protein
MQYWDVVVTVSFMLFGMFVTIFVGSVVLCGLYMIGEKKYGQGRAEKLRIVKSKASDPESGVNQPLP